MNYKIYDSVNSLLQNIKELSSLKYKFPKSPKIFSEVVLILNNENMENQIEQIRKERIKDNILNTQSHLNPFFIFISPNDINLKGFILSKTFHYRTLLKDILTFKKDEEKKANTEEILAFFRKINVLFSYYNELGDKFIFKNSQNKEVPIPNEDDTNIPVFINILLLGESGAGKSTLLNLLLDEKKSIEGGSGFPTTSKDILVYQKSDVPIRFYDVRGVEDEKTIENYIKILTKFNGKNNSSRNAINAIFYCIEYKENGTLIQGMIIKLFEKLIDFSIPIVFIITKCPYNFYQQNGSKKARINRELQREKIINVIRDLFRNIFISKKRANEFDEFMNNFIKFYFVNLKRNDSNDVPILPFGIDQLLSFFTKSVSKEDWEKLEKSCYKNEEENCKNLCKANPFLKAYAEFDKIQLRNKEEALDFLKGLKAGAFFSGWVPGLDIGMEYYYRYKFKEKLKHLYGFDYDKAEKTLKEGSQKEENNNNNDNTNEETPQFSEDDLDKRENNIKLEESKIDIEIEEEVTNKGRNAGSIIRGAGEIGQIAIKALPAAVNVAAEGGAIAAKAGAAIARGSLAAGLKIASWVLLPVTCIAFGAWSCKNIHDDCHKILDIFDKAFSPLRFQTLYNYIKSFRTAINYLENINDKILEDDKRENEEDDEELED